MKRDRWVLTAAFWLFMLLGGAGLGKIGCDRQAEMEAAHARAMQDKGFVWMHGWYRWQDIPSDEPGVKTRVWREGGGQ